MAIHRLPSNVVQTLSGRAPGKYADGGGLYLLVRADRGGQWTFRYTVNGCAGEMGLGSVRDVSLAAARQDAAHHRGVAKSGSNPKLARDRMRLERAAEARRLAYTLDRLTGEAFEARKAQLKRDGEAGRWMSPLRTHVLPRLGALPVGEIDQTVVRDTLKPIWHKAPDAAKKAANRLQIVLRHGAALGLDVDLQAVEKAKALLGAQRHSPRHIPSMPWQDVPRFFRTLSDDTASERALKFLILTAGRSGEARLAHLDEIDGDVWSLPADRMKNGRPHRVPLSKAAMNVIANSRPFARNGYLFVGHRGKPITDTTMIMFVKRRGLEARPHGFRSSFRTWCAEATDVSREIAETCLAHQTAGKVEAAYRRTDFLAQRRRLMERWAGFLSGIQVVTRTRTALREPLI